MKEEEEEEEEKKTKADAYAILVQPNVEYCCAIWNPHTADQVKKQYREEQQDMTNSDSSMKCSNYYFQVRFREYRLLVVVVLVLLLLLVLSYQGMPR